MKTRDPRTTVSLSPALHRRIRVHCAEEGVRLTDAIGRVLEAAFPEEEPPARGGSKKKQLLASADA
jgi:hypothetical protein